MQKGGPLLILAAALLALTPITRAETPPPDPDTREMLRLPLDERDMVLREMRNFVVAIHTITNGLVNENTDTVAAAARKMGSGAANQIPPRVVAKLPERFKELAGKVHTTFDAIAMDAEGFGDTQHTLEQLSELTRHCIACHATYQIREERP